ncbi:MAG: hypothetical protein HDR05_09325 [Lachnospiraceae bacterium]|nr:hypothetical protein [Lachnospiraceae bacterium]
MIHILPYMEHTIHTTKSPQEIHDIMQSVTFSKRAWVTRPPGEFIGTIEQYDFKIMRIINYRNSFMPVIKGAIKKGEGAYVVALKMQLHPLTYIFLIIWFGLAGFIFLIAVLYLITSEPMDVRMILGAGGFIAWGQILSRWGFFFQAKKDIKKLEELLSAETPAVF